MFFVFDRFIKNAIGAGRMLGPKNIIGDIFTFKFTPNYYISFSLPFSGIYLNYFIVAIIVGLFIITLYLILAKKCEKAEYLPLTFIIFGAISNSIDRFRYGYVIDYLDLKYFTVFNLADVLISTGVVWLIIKTLKDKK